MKKNFDKYFEMSSEDVDNMTVPELKFAIKDMMNAANKRLKKVRADLTNPLIEQISTKLYTQNFSSRSNNENNLKEEFRMITNFLQSKNSIQTHWNKIKASSKETFAKMAQDILPKSGKEVRAFVDSFFSHDNQVKFWNAYRKADEENEKHFAERHASDDVLVGFYQIVGKFSSPAGVKEYSGISITEANMEDLVKNVIKSAEAQEIREYNKRKDLFSNDLKKLRSSSNGVYSSSQKSSKSKSVRKKSK